MEVFIKKKSKLNLQANPVQYLATVGRDGKAKVPPIHVLFLKRMESSGSVPTTPRMSTKICRQIQRSRFLFQSGICMDSLWYGKAVFENNMAVKEGAMLNPIVRQYQTADNPDSRGVHLE